MISWSYYFFFLLVVNEQFVKRYNFQNSLPNRLKSSFTTILSNLRDTYWDKKIFKKIYKYGLFLTYVWILNFELYTSTTACVMKQILLSNTECVILKTFQYRLLSKAGLFIVEKISQHTAVTQLNPIQFGGAISPPPSGPWNTGLSV